ncbi:hypothetical protein QJQ45_026030 [Haematococcus lacustris]|nr:hypothetical protein QJQ45_026030 [Haematococcus lacustris]
MLTTARLSLARFTLGCSQPDSASCSSAASNYGTITACVQDTNSEVLRPIKVLTFTELTALLQPMYDKWTNLTGYKANIVSMPLSPGADDALTKEILFSLRSNFTTYDGYAFDTLRMTEIGQLGGFVDIRSLIAPDNSLSWDDYFPVFRESIVTYDGAVVGLPVYVGFSYMTYRRDVLADRGLVVPNTWDDVLEVARLINGTDMSGDGIGDAAICMSADGLGLFKLFINIFASIAQLGGSENGYLVDPATLGSLADSPAMTRTIEILRALAPYTVTAGIIPYSTPFIELKCAFIFQDIDIFKSTLGFVERNPHYGRTGVSIMPGSSVYLERSNNTLRPCNPTVCSDRETLLNGTVISLNRAPVIGPALLTAINPATPASFQAIVYSFLSYALGPVSNMYVYSPLIPIGPMRFSHMQQYMWLQAATIMAIIIT